MQVSESSLLICPHPQVAISPTVAATDSDNVWSSNRSSIDSLYWGSTAGGGRRRYACFRVAEAIAFTNREMMIASSETRRVRLL